MVQFDLDWDILFSLDQALAIWSRLWSGGSSTPVILVQIKRKAHKVQTKQDRCERALWEQWREESCEQPNNELKLIIGGERQIQLIILCRFLSQCQAFLHCQLRYSNYNNINYSHYKLMFFHDTFVFAKCKITGKNDLSVKKMNHMVFTVLNSTAGERSTFLDRQMRL